MPEIVMPRLSDSMEEGTILSWLKSVGDEVAVGEELVEIETDKANMAYESDVAGTLSEILAEEGDTLAIGAPIARIGGEGEGSGSAPAGPVTEDRPPAHPPEGRSSAPPADGESEASGAGSEAEAPAETAGAPAAGETADGQRVKASPLARRLAKEKGLQLAAISGSGPGGRIVKADVASAEAPAGEPAREGRPSTPPAAEAESGETAKGRVTYQELSRLQQVVARRMSESKATAPHFYLRAAVDMSRAVEARGRLKAAASEGEVVPSFNDMAVKACALALGEHPRANGAYRDGRFELYSRVNVGVAVAGPDALVVPTVFDADRKGLRQIAAEARELAGRVRDSKIAPPELSGATFTVSNLGMYGIEGFSAVINPPQAAILAVGAIAEEPVVRDGQIATAHVMRVDLACDHRILYGADAAEFLARIVALLEEPVGLAL